MKRSTATLIALTVVLSVLGAGLFVRDLQTVRESAWELTSAQAARRNSEAFDRVLNPTVTEPWPKLTGSPAPLFINTLEDSGLNVQWEEPSSPNPDQFFTVFAANPAGEVTLPGGGVLRLNAIAFSDFTRDLPLNVSLAQRKLLWLDPVTYHPLGAARTQGLPTQAPNSDPAPRLHLHFSTTGPPTRTHWPKIFDAKTKSSLSSGGSQSRGTYHLQLQISLQSPIILALDFAYGTPETKEFSLETSASIGFGDEVAINVIHTSPNNLSFRRSRSSAHEHHSFFAKNQSGAPTAVIGVWPKLAQKQLQFAMPGTTKPDWDNVLNTVAAFYFSPTQNTSPPLAQVRRFPHLGRAVFQLQPIPMFAPGDNLFDLAIPRHLLTRDHDLDDVIREHTGISFFAKLSDHRPYQYTQGTISLRDLVRQYQQKSGQKLYFHPKSNRIDTTPPPTRWEELMRWWRGP